MKMRRLLMVGVVGVAVIFLAGQALAEPITINWWHCHERRPGRSSCNDD